jgi:hypothetical protein
MSVGARVTIRVMKNNTLQKIIMRCLRPYEAGTKFFVLYENKRHRVHFKNMDRDRYILI